MLSYISGRKNTEDKAKDRVIKDSIELLLEGMKEDDNDNEVAEEENENMQIRKKSFKEANQSYSEVPF